MNGEEPIIVKDGKKYRCVPNGPDSFILVHVNQEGGASTSVGSNAPAKSILIKENKDKRKDQAKLEEDMSDSGEDSNDEDDVLHNEHDDDDEDDDDEDGEEEEREGHKKNGGKNSKKNKADRVGWGFAETEKFLEICFEKHVVQKIDGKMGQNLSLPKIFKFVAKELKQAELSKKEKSHIHCKNKFKSLRKKYRQVMRKNLTSGERKHECTHFELLHKLFFKRPIIKCEAWGFDSKGSEESSSTPTSDNTPNLSEGDEKPPKPSLPVSKYRSGAGKPSATNKLSEWLEKEEIDAKTERDFLREEMRAQRASDNAMLQNLTTAMTQTINSGFEAFGKMMMGMGMGMQMQGQPQFSNIWNMHGVPGNFASQSSQSPSILQSFTNIPNLSSPPSTPPTSNTVPTTPIAKTTPPTIPTRKETPPTTAQSPPQRPVNAQQAKPSCSNSTAMKVSHSKPQESISHLQVQPSSCKVGQTTPNSTVRLPTKKIIRIPAASFQAMVQKTKGNVSGPLVNTLRFKAPIPQEKNS